MDQTIDIRASVEISLKTQDISSFRKSILECKRIEEVCDNESSNILHELSTCQLSDSDAIQYLHTAIEVLKSKEDDYCISMKAVSYTHLTLPTNREV